MSVLCAHHMTRFLATLGLSTVLATSAAAQRVTQWTLGFGVSGTSGCQNPAQNPPRLTNGVPATASVQFTYDNVTNILTLDVTNNSPVNTIGNPVITELAFNLPLGAVNGTGPLTQSSAAGAAPGFTLKVDPGQTPQLRMGCFGGFGIQLTADKRNGAIGNAAASVFSVGNVAFGPAQLSFQLKGPGTPYLTARTIAVGFSSQALLRPVNAAMSFEGAGVAGNGGGTINGIDEAGLGGSNQPSVWLSAAPNASRPTLPNAIPLCFSAQPGVHGCAIFSSTPGPTVFGSLTLPIGMIEAAIPLTMPPSGSLCLPIVIGQNLIGMTIYTTLVVPSNSTGPAPVPSPAPEPKFAHFAPRFDIVVLPVL